MREPEPNSPSQGKKDPAVEAAELRSRLDALRADLGTAKAAEDHQRKQSGAASPNGGALSAGLRAGSELVAGVLVGCGIGYLLDRQFGVSPLFLIIFMVMGMAAGFWNVYRLGLRKSDGGVESGK
jgi:ATP synthase protein I